MKSYKQNQYSKGGIIINKSKSGEMLETKVERMINNKEKIGDTTDLIYTERKEGVRPATDIRTDRWEIAAEASTKIAKSFAARRNNSGKKDGKAEPIHDTTTQQDDAGGAGTTGQK